MAGSAPTVELGVVVIAPSLALVMQFPGTTLPPQLLESLGRLPMLEVLNLSNYEPQNMMRTERIILFDDLKALARCLNLKRLDLSNLVLPFCMVRLSCCTCVRVLSRIVSQSALQLDGVLRTRVLGRVPDACLYARRRPTCWPESQIGTGRSSQGAAPFTWRSCACMAVRSTARTWTT